MVLNDEEYDNTNKTIFKMYLEEYGEKIAIQKHTELWKKQLDKEIKEFRIALIKGLKDSGN
jgi:hypothetical protein